MENFSLYLQLGWQHIISPDALDHQLFLLALAACYSVKKWKRLLILITAFTIGHSLTLALSASESFRISSYWIEILIPATIGFTALSNFRFVQGKPQIETVAWSLAALFGLIHGLGFANTLKSLLGREQSILVPLFGFNIGIELGQIAVLLVVSGIQLLVLRITKITIEHWAAFVSGLALAGSVWMVVGRMFD